jgi:hypothetical protein
VRTRIIRKKLEGAMSGLPIHDNRAIEEAEIYLSMSPEGLAKLPQFNPDGEPTFYDIGGVLMGKLTLLRFIETIKNR